MSHKQVGEPFAVVRSPDVPRHGGGPYGIVPGRDDGRYYSYKWAEVLDADCRDGRGYDAATISAAIAAFAIYSQFYGPSDECDR